MHLFEAHHAVSFARHVEGEGDQAVLAGVGVGQVVRLLEAAHRQVQHQVHVVRVVEAAAQVRAVRLPALLGRAAAACRPITRRLISLGVVLKLFL